MEVFADLHIHTTYSDGNDSPAEVVRAAAGSGLGAVAITDHDCTSGMDEAIGEGMRLGIEVIPGVEVNAYVDSFEVHVLGYFIDHRTAALLRALEDLQEKRVTRLYRMIEKLEEMGVRIEPGRVMSIAGAGAVGRPHVAKVLVDEGYASSIKNAFRRFIGNRAPAYVRRSKLSPGEAIQIIKSAGGIAVLAHPGDLGDDGLIPSLIADGIEGIEVYYRAHGTQEVSRYLGIARKLGLVITGGSDYHGSLKGDTISIGDFGIDRLLYDELIEYEKKR